MLEFLKNRTSIRGRSKRYELLFVFGDGRLEVCDVTYDQLDKVKGYITIDDEGAGWPGKKAYFRYLFGTDGVKGDRFVLLESPIPCPPPEIRLPR